MPAEMPAQPGAEATMFYEIATLSLALWGAQEAAEGVAAYTSDSSAKGRLLGCWATELGPLRRLLVLRGFEDAEDLAAERQRGMASANPFGAGAAITGLTMESYAPFPFLPPVTPGRYGPVYEFRTYLLKVGGLLPTMAGWEAAMPKRSKLGPLILAMYALDGAPRITHIWPFAGLDARAAVRKESYATGIWPPKGGPEQIAEGSSTIALPMAISPLA